MSENFDNLENKISQIIDLIRNTKNSYDFSAETYIHILEKINNRLNEIQGLEPSDLLELRERVKELSSAFKSLDNKNEIKYLTEQVEYVSAAQQKSDKNINEFTKSSYEILQKLSQFDPSSSSFVNELKTEVVNALDVVKKNLAEFEEAGIAGLKKDIQSVAQIVKDSHLELTRGAQESLQGVVGEFKSYIEQAHSKLNLLETNVQDSLRRNTDLISQTMSEDLVGNIYVLKNAIVAIKDSLDGADADKVDKNFLNSQMTALQDKFMDLSINANMSISQELLKLGNGLVTIKAAIDGLETSNFSKEIIQQFKGLEKKFSDIDVNISQRLVHELNSMRDESALLKDAVLKNQIDGDFVRRQYETIENHYKDLDFNITTTFTNEFSQLLSETLELKKALVYLKDTQLDTLYVKEQFSAIVDKYDVLNNNIAVTITNEFTQLKENSEELRRVITEFEGNQVDRLFLQTQLDAMEQRFLDIDVKIGNTISNEFAPLKEMQEMIRDLYSRQIDENMLKIHFDNMQEKFIDLNINTNMAISQELLKLNEEFINIGKQLQLIDDKQVDKAVIQSTLQSIEEKFTDLNLNINNNFFEELSGLNQQSLILRETLESLDGKLVDRAQLREQLERIETKYSHIDESLSVGVNNELQQLSQDTTILKDMMMSLQDKQLDGSAFNSQFEAFALKFQELDKNIALTVSSELMSLREETSRLNEIVENFARAQQSSGGFDGEGLTRINQQMFELDSKIELLTKDINLNISHEIASQRDYLEAFAAANAGSQQAEPVKELLEEFGTRLQDLESNVTLSISNEIMAIRQEASFIRDSFDNTKDNTQLFEQFDSVREKIAQLESQITEAISPQVIQLREAIESLNHDEDKDGALSKQLQSLQYKIDSLEANLNTSYIFNEFKSVQEKIAELDTNISLAVSHELIEVREETAAIRDAIEKLGSNAESGTSRALDQEALNGLYERFEGVFSSLDEVKSKYQSIEKIDNIIEKLVAQEILNLKDEAESLRGAFNAVEARINDGSLVHEQFEKFIERFNQLDASINSTISYEISQIRQDSLSVKELIEEYQYKQGDEATLKEILYQVKDELSAIDKKIAGSISAELDKVREESVSIRGSLDGLTGSGVIDEKVSEQIALLFDKLNSISASISTELGSIKDESENLKIVIENYKPQEIDETAIFNRLDELHAKFSDIEGLMNNIVIDDVQKIREYTSKIQVAVDDIKDVKLEQVRVLELVGKLDEKISEIATNVSHEVLSDLQDIKIDANAIKETTAEGFVRLQNASDAIAEKLVLLDQKLSVLDNDSNTELFEGLQKITAETQTLKEVLSGVNLKQIDDELVKAEFRVLQDKFQDIDASINSTISQEMSQIRQETLAMKEFFEDIEFNQIDEEMLNNHFNNVSERIAKFEMVIDESLKTEMTQLKEDYNYLKELANEIDGKQIDKLFFTKNFENIKERIFDLDSKLNQRITEEFSLVKEDATAIKILTENLIKSQTTTILDEFEVVRDKFNDLQVYINDSDNSLFDKMNVEIDGVKQEAVQIKQLIRDLDEKQVTENLVEEHLVSIKDKLQSIDIDVTSKVHQELTAIKEETKLVKNTLSNIEETQIDKLTIKEQFEYFSDKFNKFKENIESGIADSFVSILSDSNALKDVFNDIEIKQFDGGFIKSQIEGVLEKFDRLDISLNSSLLEGLSKYSTEMADIRAALETFSHNVIEKGFINAHFEEIQRRIHEFDASLTGRVLTEIEKLDKSSSVIKESVKNFESAVNNIARIEANQIDLAESLRGQIDKLQEQMLVQMLQLFENIQFYDETEDIKEHINSFKDKLSEDVANIKFMLSSGLEGRNDVFDGVLDTIDELKDLNARVKEVLASSKDVENGIESLQSKVAELQNGMNAVDTLSSQLSAIQKIVEEFDLSGLSSQVDGISAKLDDVSNVVAELETVPAKLDDIHYAVRDLPTGMDEVRGEISSLEKKVSDIPSLIHHLDDNLSKDVKEMVQQVEESKSGVNDINNRLEALLYEVKNLTRGADENSSTYGLPDVEADIAKVRLALSEVSTMFQKEHSMADESLAGMAQTLELIQRDVESFTKAIPSVEFMRMRDQFAGLSDDITSISKRTNKLIITSDNSNKNLQDNLSELRDIAKKLSNGANVGDRLDNIDNALMYFAEWIDSASATMNDIKLDMGVVKENADPMKTEPTFVEVQTLKLLINDLHAKVKQGFSDAAAQEKKINSLEKLIKALDKKISPDSDDDFMKRLEGIERQMIKFEKNINKIVAFIDEE